MSALVLHIESNTVVGEGRTLRHSDGTRWKFVGTVVREGEHMLHMMRKCGSRVLRRMFLAHEFGCTIMNHAKIIEHALTVKAKLIEMWWAGIIALLPLAIFEHYHLADHLFTLLGMGAGGE